MERFPHFKLLGSLAIGLCTFSSHVSSRSIFNIIRTSPSAEPERTVNSGFKQEKEVCQIRRSEGAKIHTEWSVNEQWRISFLMQRHTQHELSNII